LKVLAGSIPISCDYVVLATHVPLMGKASLLAATQLQTKLVAYSTYAVSGELREERIPEATLWDTSNPYYYLRTDAEEGGVQVIFGGEDHKTGQVEDTDECFRRLQNTLHDILPGVQINRRWSGQVIGTHDGLPLIGETAERQFVATGYNGNGITFGAIAARMACDAVLKKENPWQDLLSVDRKSVLRGAWDYVKQNLDFPFYLVADRLRSSEVMNPEELAAGEGTVLRMEGRRVACSRTVDGELHCVSAVCTHLGCLVRWNAAEQTWDCPCHGSRFHPSGEVLAGPAESSLESLASLPSSR
jgi:Rieske Fe-S protein